MKVRGRKLRFAFRGKSGVFQTIEIEAPQLAKAVQQCQDLPGQTLFQYRDDQRKVQEPVVFRHQPLPGRDQRRPLHREGLSDLGGNVDGGAGARRPAAGKSKTAGNKVIVEAVDSVAEALGNTRAVCRKCYIHPAVLDAYMSGITLSKVEPVRAKAMKGLLDAEARLVSLLRRADRIRKAKAA